MTPPSRFDVIRTGPGEPGPGDEVSRDLALVDWKATPLGPPEGWPQSLVTALRIVLGSRFSMWMAWGPDLTFFCNHAYRRDTLGVKYPWALGRPAREVWAEIWDVIGGRIDGVLQTGEATWDEALPLMLERSGYAEESFHTFSYSPLAGDEGRITGMLCVVSEDTDRVIAERRMATLRRLGADAPVTPTQADVVAAIGRNLGTDPEDLPFSLVYLLEADGVARLGAASGITPGHPAAPTSLDPGQSLWPLRPGGLQVVDGLRERFSGLPTGPWPDPPTSAAVVPLVEGGHDAPYGFLVAGLNPHRPFDSGFRGFIDLLARQATAQITTARDYEQQRARADALAELDRAKTAFFTNVSHEFRTPLTLLLGPVEDALQDPVAALDPVQRQRLELVERNAQRLLRLVNSLLDFSRLSSGTSAPRFEPVDLAELTAELASTFSEAVTRAGLTLDIVCPPMTEPVDVDRDMWATLLLNLLSNALKFTFEGGVTVRLQRAGDDAVLTVADTGIGVEPDEQARLFERFHRVVGARSRTHEGSGIGLALVAELAAVHGGSVEARSQVGVGTTFTVRIPTAPRAEPGLAPARDHQVAAERQAAGFVAEALRWLDVDAAPAPAGDGAAPGERRARILVADDSADMRAYLRGLLGADYDVDTAADGAAALRQALAEPPDLVLSDVMMPELDGFGLLQGLRANPSTLHVPVVMLSARGGEEGTIQGLEAGADDYLVKPFAARELLARVRANLELERAVRVRDELRRRQAMLDQAEHLAHVGSWEVPADGEAVRASQEMLRMLGVGADALSALGPAEIIDTFVHPDDRVAVHAALDQLGADGASFDLEARLRPAGGGERLVRLRAESAIGADGRPATVRGIAQDITEQRRGEEAIAAAAAAREAAAREHRVAEELQTSLLPALSFTPDHLDVATYYRAGAAGTRVGGDWYDVIELGAGRTALVVGDVMGRGVHAAAVMGQLRSAVRAYARLDLRADELLGLLDGAVRELGDDQIVTCIYAVYDPFDRSLCWANAGHPPPVLASPDGAGILLAGVGTPLGTGPATFETMESELPPGSLLCLYTDGLVERRDDRLDERIEALAVAVHALAAGGDELGGPGGPAAALACRLLPSDAEDDVAVLLARTPPATSAAATSLQVPDDRRAVRGVRRSLAGVLAEWGVERRADDIVLAVDELVTNAVVHGTPPIEIRLRRTDRRLYVEVIDGATLLPQAVRPGPDDEHGRGLQMVGLLSERWGTRATRTGKSVWCSFLI